MCSQGGLDALGIPNYGSRRERKFCFRTGLVHSECSEGTWLNLQLSAGDVTQTPQAEEPTVEKVNIINISLNAAGV